MHQPEQRCSTGQHALPLGQTCPGLPTQSAREIEQAALQRLRPSTSRRSQFWSLLGEDAPRTAPVAAEEPTDLQLQGDALVGPGQVSQGPLVVAVDAMRSAGAERAAGGATSAGEFQGHAVISDQEAFKAEATKLREQRTQEG